MVFYNKEKHTHPYFDTFAQIIQMPLQSKPLIPIFLINLYWRNSIQGKKDNPGESDIAGDGVDDLIECNWSVNPITKICNTVPTIFGQNPVAELQT